MRYEFPWGTVTSDKVYTPDPLLELPEGDIFVAATNTLGQHGGGSAAYAHRFLGLPWGFAEGLYDRVYAFPTLDWTNYPGKRVTLEALNKSFELFFEAVRANPKKTFWLTKIGCGIAGWDILEMKRNFWKHYTAEINLVYPPEFELTDDEVDNW